MSSPPEPKPNVGIDNNLTAPPPTADGGASCDAAFQPTTAATATNGLNGSASSQLGSSPSLSDLLNNSLFNSPTPSQSGASPSLSDVMNSSLYNSPAPSHSGSPSTPNLNSRPDPGLGSLPSSAAVAPMNTSSSNVTVGILPPSPTLPGSGSPTGSSQKAPTPMSNARVIWKPKAQAGSRTAPKPKIPKNPKPVRGRPRKSSKVPSPPTSSPESSTSGSQSGDEEDAPPPAPSCSAEPPQPPNWQSHLSERYTTKYRKFTVDPGTKEYTVIETLMPTLKVTSVEQVLNPALWKRFTNERKEMFTSKTDNVQLLKNIGLDDAEVARVKDLSAAHKRDPRLNQEASKYSPNEALLFHCTRDEGTIHDIFSEGLDDRVCHSGRLLGRGIYFSDDCLKAIQYDQSGGNILVFMVLLGDCLSVDRGLDNPSSLVREPKKEAQQKRLQTDDRFNSITGRPKKPSYNEYVIFDRPRCCPLYLVKYEPKKSPKAGAGEIDADTNGLDKDLLKSLTTSCASARKQIPMIAWRAKTKRASDIPMPNPNPKGTWPFSARYLFELMGVDNGPGVPVASGSTKKPPIPSTATATTTLSNIPPTSAQAKVTASTSSSSNDRLTKKNLGRLEKLGFQDEKLNKKALKKFNNKVDLAVNYILDKDSKASTAPPTSAATVPRSVPGNAPSTSTSSSNHVTTATGTLPKTEPPSPSKVTEMLMSFSATAIASNMSNVASPPTPSASTSSGNALVNDLLAQLQELGFTDDKKNREALKRCQNILDEAINYILDNQVMTPATSGSSANSPPKLPAVPTASTSGSISILGKREPEPIIDLVSGSSPEKAESLLGSTSHKNRKRKKTPRTVTGQSSCNCDDCLANRYSSSEEEGPDRKKPKREMAAPPPPTAEEKEACSICYEEYPAFSNAPSNWVELNCSHRICKSCHENTEKIGTTMAGVEHTFSRCPFCKEITGIQVGDCPDGKMTVTHIPDSCDGYPDCGSIQIDYQVKSKRYKLNRTAYLPDNEEGKEFLKLLEMAWDRRLCFAIGTSLTTGQEDVLVWNIHHKTSLAGGSHGYPDPEYFERTKWDMKALGIE